MLLLAIASRSSQSLLSLLPIPLTRPFSSLPPHPFPASLPVQCLKSKGQYILNNPHILQTIVDKAGVLSTDTVLEIGPGTGNLTLRLLEAARKVIAVELDPRMVAELHRRVQQTDYAGKLELIQGDVLRMELPSFDICVANIPYQISSPLTFKLLSHASKFRAAVLMFQKEFAKRLRAKPGDSMFCRLSVNAQLLASIDFLMEVSKRNFSPTPRVDSSVVRISPNPWPPPVNLREWDALVRLCFSRKNKTLGAIFRQKSVLSFLYRHPSLSLQVNEKVPGIGGVNALSREPLNADKVQYDVIFPFDDETPAIKHKNETDEFCNNGNQVQEMQLFKERVLHVLQKGGYEEKRSVKLTQGDFLKVLSSFNKAGIFFT